MHYLRALLLLAYVPMAVLGAPAADAAAEPAPIAVPEPAPLGDDASLLEKRQGTWACSVPAGYIYTAVRSSLNVCGGTGFSTQYLIRQPADGVWSCTTATPAFTWDSVRSSLSTCSTTGFATSYHLRTPKNGLWACYIPPGWTFTSTQSSLSTCSTSGFANSYQLFR